MKILILLLFLVCDMTDVVVHNNEEAVQDKFQHAECMAHWFFVVIVSAGAVFIANCPFKDRIFVFHSALSQLGEGWLYFLWKCLLKFVF